MIMEASIKRNHKLYLYHLNKTLEQRELPETEGDTR